MEDEGGQTEVNGQMEIGLYIPSIGTQLVLLCLQ